MVLGAGATYRIPAGSLRFAQWRVFSTDTIGFHVSQPHRVERDENGRTHIANENSHHQRNHSANGANGKEHLERQGHSDV